MVKLIMFLALSAALFGVLILLPAPPASAQSRDGFSCWEVGQR